MDIKSLEAFIRVQEMHSFTKAAVVLGYTQSTVSFQIKQLEQEIGAPLFERLGRNVMLTNEGAKLLPIAHEMLRLYSEATHISAAERTPGGLVRIAIAESLAHYIFMNGFRRFHENYPDIRLKLISGSSENMFRALSENSADLVYTLDRPILDGRYAVALNEPVKMWFAAAPGHPLAGFGKPVPVSELVRYPLILTEKNMSYRAMIDEFIAKNDLSAEPLVEVGDTHLICELLRHGVGISCLPEYILEHDFRIGTLVPITVRGMNPKIRRQLLFDKNKWLSPEICCVIEQIKHGFLAIGESGNDKKGSEDHGIL